MAGPSEGGGMLEVVGAQRRDVLTAGDVAETERDALGNVSEGAGPLDEAGGPAATAKGRPSRPDAPEGGLGDKLSRCEVVLEDSADVAHAWAFVTCSYQTSNSRTVVYAKEVEGWDSCPSEWGSSWGSSRSRPTPAAQPATTTETEHGVNNKRQPNAAPKPSQRGNIHVCCRLQDAKTLCLVCARRIRWDNYE